MLNIGSKKTSYAMEMRQKMWDLGASNRDGGSGGKSRKGC